MMDYARTERDYLRRGILPKLQQEVVALPHIFIWRILVNQIFDFLAFRLSAAAGLEGTRILCYWNRYGFLRRRTAL
jgi:hypothetical protein